MATETWRGVDNLAADFAMPREFMLRASPAHARLLELLETGFTRHAEPLEAAWGEREFAARYERPLLLLASLRFEALRDGPAHPLWAGIGAAEPDPHALTSERLDAALAPERESLWESLRTRFVQTNETSRAVAWLWPASLLPAGSTLELFDLGASAGLNLLGDRLPLPWREESGAPLLSTPPAAEVVGRTAFDAHPLDATDPDGARWLRACVWPGQGERLARLDEALALVRETPPDLQRARAHEMPSRIEPAHTGSRVIAYQSLLRDYLDPSERQGLTDGMHGLLRRHAPGRVLWLELEQEGRDEPPRWSTLLRGHVLDGEGEVQALALARTHPHPVDLRVDAAAVARLRTLLDG